MKECYFGGRLRLPVGEEGMKEEEAEKVEEEQ